MTRFSLLVAAAAIVGFSGAALADHKEGHANPPGFENNLSRDHNNTVNTNAGCGNGGEEGNTFAPVEGEDHVAFFDVDPGNSEENNQAGENCQGGSTPD